MDYTIQHKIFHKNGDSQKEIAQEIALIIGSSTATVSYNPVESTDFPDGRTLIRTMTSLYQTLPKEFLEFLKTNGFEKAIPSKPKVLEEQFHKTKEPKTLKYQFYQNKVFCFSSLFCS